MIIDGNTGEMLNAVTVPFSQLVSTGIDDVAADETSVKVAIANGSVVVSAQGDIEVSLYMPNGALIGSAQGSESVSVATGDYHGVVIVKIATDEGVTAQKIIL